MKISYIIAVAFLATGMVLPVWNTQAQDESLVQVELVLCVDASSSVSYWEFNLQMQGIAEAFRHPLVGQSIEQLGPGGIAVTLVQWADARTQRIAVDWVLVRNGIEAAAFADAVDASPRYMEGGGTAIGAAMEFAARQFDRNGFSGLRRVIDISGDGRNNQGRHPSTVRDDLIPQGIVINGLAILNEDQFVDSHYSEYMIGGEDAFVITAVDYQDFASAMLEKILREISGVPIVMAPASGLQTVAVNQP